jgi:hypothetical protein
MLVIVFIVVFFGKAMYDFVMSVFIGIYKVFKVQQKLTTLSRLVGLTLLLCISLPA